ncbi:hypothetical protein, partial [Stagnihabitans tardus]|uniref:hypothetical protein n=1 Tax=Stagnihabitans tardus TaxID=2699202 RepID=UPI001D10EAE1
MVDPGGLQHLQPIGRIWIGVFERCALFWNATFHGSLMFGTRQGAENEDPVFPSFRLRAAQDRAL